MHKIVGQKVARRFAENTRIEILSIETSLEIPRDDYRNFLDFVLMRIHGSHDRIGNSSNLNIEGILKAGNGRIVKWVSTFFNILSSFLCVNSLNIISKFLCIKYSYIRSNTTQNTNIKQISYYKFNIGINFFEGDLLIFFWKFL